MITGEALRFVGIGTGIGLVLSLVLSRVVRLFLFGMSPTDPIAYGIVVVVLGGVALVASYIPVRRAGAVDPSIARRAD